MEWYLEHQRPPLNDSSFTQRESTTNPDLGLSNSHTHTHLNRKKRRQLIKLGGTAAIFIHPQSPAIDSLLLCVQCACLSLHFQRCLSTVSCYIGAQGLCFHRGCFTPQSSEHFVIMYDCCVTAAPSPNSCFSFAVHAPLQGISVFLLGNKDCCQEHFPVVMTVTYVCVRTSVALRVNEGVGPFNLT